MFCSLVGIDICPVCCFLYGLLLLCILCFCAYEAIPPQKVTNGNPQGILAIMLKLLFFPLISGAADKEKERENERKSGTASIICYASHQSNGILHLYQVSYFYTFVLYKLLCNENARYAAVIVVGGVSDPCIKMYCCSCYSCISACMHYLL